MFALAASFLRVFGGTATGSGAAAPAAAVLQAAQAVDEDEKRNDALLVGGKVVLEDGIPAHDPSVYNASKQALTVDGWQTNPEVVAQFKRDGYLLIKGGYTSGEVEKCVSELKGLMLSNTPKVNTVYFEGMINKRLEEFEKEKAEKTPISAASTAASNTTAGGEGSSSSSAAGDRSSEHASTAGTQLASLALGKVGTKMPALPPQERARFVRKFMGFANKHNPNLHASAFKPELLEMCATLTEAAAGVRLFQDMSMVKPPGGREKPWHQDRAYFNLGEKVNVVGVWISLGDTTKDSGAMHMLPGFHTVGPQHHFKRRDWQICDATILKLKDDVVLAEMGPGDVLLFDSLLPHGTPTNTTDKQRFALQYHYVPNDTEVLPDESLRLSLFGGEGAGAVC